MTGTDAPVSIPVQRLPHAGDLPLPAFATPGAAAMDLRAAIAEPLTLPPLGRALVPTGIAVALPVGLEAQVRPRSGLALSQGLTVLNAPGTIDADYRGEIGVILINLGDRPVQIMRGDRVAQILIAACVPFVWDEDTTRWSTTDRHALGFGSTGTR